MLDQRVGDRKEAQIGRASRQARQVEHELAGIVAELATERSLLRQRCDGGLDPRLGGLVDRTRGGDGEVEREGAFLGNADLLADEPGRLGLQRKVLAGLGIGGNRDLERQQDRAFEAEIDEGRCV